jgi:dienelactone hydrolase
VAASQAALEAMTEVGIVERATTFQAPGADPFIVSRQACFRLEGDGRWGEGSFRSEARVELPGGYRQRTVCLGSASRQTCQTQAAAQPWFHDATVEASPSWPALRREFLAEASATGSATVAEDGSLLIGWTAESSLASGLTLRGESWLDATSLRPRREVLSWIGDEMLWTRQEISYTACDTAQSLEPPPVATVTPSPAIAEPPQSMAVNEASAPLPGALFVPEGGGPFPAVIVLHGSEGGVDATSTIARRLASGGFVAFALCYFGCPETPATLENVNVEAVTAAVAYLLSRQDTRGEQVGVLGFSRGAELALISAALDPAVGPVVSVMGSPWVWGSLPPGGSAWLYEGQPLPFVVIPVEEAKGPVLLLHGQQDSIWPVSYSYFLAERLAARGHDFELVIYPRRAHDLGLNPFDVLNRTITFLHQGLAPSESE